jgi:hypothetical protein
LAAVQPAGAVKVAVAGVFAVGMTALASTTANPVGATAGPETVKVLPVAGAEIPVRFTTTGKLGLVALQYRLTVDALIFNCAAACMVPAEPSIASSATTACEPQILNDDNFIKDLPLLDFWTASGRGRPIIRLADLYIGAASQCFRGFLL